MDCSWRGSSVRRLLQAWILEWVAIPFSRGSSWPRDWTKVSCIPGRSFSIWATREAPSSGGCRLISACNHLLTPSLKASGIPSLPLDSEGKSWISDHNIPNCRHVHLGLPRNPTEAAPTQIWVVGTACAYNTEFWSCSLLLQIPFVCFLIFLYSLSDGSGKVLQLALQDFFEILHFAHLSQACFGASGLEADHFVMLKWSKVAQSCPTLCAPMDCSLPGSSIHGLFQVRVPKCVAISFSRGSSQPRDQTQVTQIVGRCFTIWATREVPCHAEQPAY